MICPNCGSDTNDYSTYCSNCGKELHPKKVLYYEKPEVNDDTYYIDDNGQVNAIQDQNREMYTSIEKSSKDKIVTFLLCLFLGEFGAHYFYVGRIGRGILYFFTLGLFGIGIIVDLILILCDKFKDKYGIVIR